MDRVPPPPHRDSFLARFENGPLNGGLRRLAARPSGGPPEYVSVPGPVNGAYALAGDQRLDGTLPYWWIPLSEGTDPEQAFAWDPDARRTPVPGRGRQHK